MMERVKTWWRGWDEHDLASVMQKIDEAKSTKPGTVTFFTERERRAHLAFMRAQYPMLEVRQ